MKSNFEIFPEELKILEVIGKNAEENIFTNPNTTLSKLRQFAETIVDLILKKVNLEINNFTKFKDKISILDRKGFLGDNISQVLYYLRKIGNSATHNANYGDTEEAMKLLRLAHHLSNWYLKTYINNDFQEQKFIKPKKEKSVEEYKTIVKELEKQLEIQVKDYEDKISKISTNSITIEEIKASVKKFEKNVPLDEASTRLLIDEQLRNNGWEVDTDSINYKKNKTIPEKNKNKAIAEWPCGKGYADYALFIGLELVGIVEAKKSQKDISSDLGQAKDYAKNIVNDSNFEINYITNEYKVPFIYSTNGRKYLKQFEEKSGIWFWDSRTPKKHSYALQNWHSPDDLKQKLIAELEEDSLEKLNNEPMPNIASRYYQEEAIKKVEEAISDGQRRMLVAMATGTGKTRTAISLMYRLLKTKTVRRILFLVDRTSLGNQTLDALKDSKVENIAISDIYDVKGLGDINPDLETKIHISTVQGMVKRIFHSDNVPSVGTYDFIIVDEAHRGYTEDKDMSDIELLYYDEEDYKSQYRKVIDYFDAKVLGLTATPALHTTEIFGMPIYGYSYQDAVLDGYLVDHEPPYQYTTILSEQGIHYDKGKEVTFWNNSFQDLEKAQLEDELNFEIADFNKKIIVEGFNRAIIKELVKQIEHDGVFKTLVFAATDLHADSIVKIFKEEYENIGYPADDDAIVKITGSVKDTEKLIKKYKNEKYPSIAVTVDLLTTGVDVPKIANLVFLRRVKSRILYDQMLGRATRLAEGKENFYIYDAVHLYDSLEEITDMKLLVKTPIKEIEKLFNSAKESTTEDAYNQYRNDLVLRLQRKKNLLNSKTIEEIEDALNIKSYNKFLQQLKVMPKEKFVSLEAEIKYLSKVKNTYRDGYIISDEEDKVTEFKRGYGFGNERPEDYLTDFDNFIKENIDKVHALKVIVTKPSDLTKKDIEDVARELKKHNFNSKSLNNAWRDVKQEDITADIISHIRKAALKVPLFDKKERVYRIMRTIRELQTWNKIQLKFLEKIEKQLINNDLVLPSIEEIDNYRIFKNDGGHKVIRKQFDEEQIQLIIKTINDNLYV